MKEYIEKEAVLKLAFMQDFDDRPSYFAIDADDVEELPVIRIEEGKMLIDFLQDLFDAIVEKDEERIETDYVALESYGMDRETADEVLNAGMKFFGKKHEEGAG